jgi:hypothetical protein
MSAKKIVYDYEARDAARTQELDGASTNSEVSGGSLLQNRFVEFRLRQEFLQTSVLLL